MTPAKDSFLHFLPSTQITSSKSACQKFVFLIVAPSRFELCKSENINFVFVKFAFLKLQFFKFALVKFAPERLAPSKLEPSKSALEKLHVATLDLKNLNF
jgi:hypothetical protein